MNTEKNYTYPTKELLNDNNEEIDNKKHYNLSKILLKKDMNDKLIIPIGIDKQKNKYYVDLKNSSGIFIGGETGSGKSVLLSSIITTLLFKNSPIDLKLLLIDPSKVELNQYKNIPHLLRNVISNPQEALEQLNNITKIIEERKEKLHYSKTRNIEMYNEYNENKLSHIIIIIDESADIMKLKDTKETLEKILKEGYYLGIHLILATSAYFKTSFDEEFIDLFKYVLSLDLASEEQAQFLKLKGADLLTVSGEVMIKTQGNIDIIQTPYISTEQIDKVVKFITEN